MRLMHNRILLIEPPFYRLFKETYSLHRYPLGIAYLAATVRLKTKWRVTAYNADFSPVGDLPQVSYLAGAGFQQYLKNLKDLSGPVWQEVSRTIAAFKPRVVGISAKSQNFSSACIVAKLAKDFDRNVTVVMGGPHASMVGGEVLKCREIDVCVRGEGEETIVELLEAIDAGEKLEGIKGLVFEDGDAIIENSPRGLIEDLDSLVFPHEGAPDVLKDYEQYPPKAFGHIFAIRGCPYNCFYCGSREVWSRKPRFRSPENVVEEIQSLRRKGLKVVDFDDDTFGVNRRYIFELCGALVARCPGLTWSCELHVKLVDEETLSILKKSGCTWLNVGIESGNNEILKKIRKDFSIEEALAACELIRKYGIGLSAFFMVGFPWETEDTLRDTWRAMKRCRSDAISYSIFTPYPGTEAFEFCKENGLIDADFDLSLYHHQSPANCFSMYIPPERFRQLVARIERIVDRKIRFNTIRKAFSLRNIPKLKEFGIRESIEKGRRLLLGRM